MLIKPKKKFWMTGIAPYYAAISGAITNGLLRRNATDFLLLRNGSDFLLRGH